MRQSYTTVLVVIYSLVSAVLSDAGAVLEQYPWNG